MKSLYLLLFFALLFITGSVSAQKITYDDLLSEKLTISDNNGQFSELDLDKVTTDYILLDFWATWCKPCIAAHPKLEEVNQKNKENLTIITISFDKRENFLSYIKNWDARVIKALDENLLFFKKYKISIIPAMILIDRKSHTLKVFQDRSVIKLLNKLSKEPLLKT